MFWSIALSRSEPCSSPGFMESMSNSKLSKVIIVEAIGESILLFVGSELMSCFLVSGLRWFSETLVRHWGTV